MAFHVFEVTDSSVRWIIFHSHPEIYLSYLFTGEKEQGWLSVARFFILTVFI